MINKAGQPPPTPKRKTRLSDQILNLKTLQKEVTYDDKLNVVHLAIKNPTWSLDKLKKVSGCSQLKFVSQLHDWKREISMKNGSW